jgi:hypothetical protein
MIDKEKIIIYDGFSSLALIYELEQKNDKNLTQKQQSRLLMLAFYSSYVILKNTMVTKLVQVSNSIHSNTSGYYSFLSSIIDIIP